jgi:hypothetical protein
MSCPDELALDLWSAKALPPEEAAAISAHVASCLTCTAQLDRSRAMNALLQAALGLDQDERTYLAGLDLAAAWRARSANASDSRWGWVTFLGLVAAFIAWNLAAPGLGQVLATADQVGVGVVLLTTTLGLLLGAAHSLIDVSTNPALGLSQPLLALVALALLFWPRITSAPHYPEGARS